MQEVPKGNHLEFGRSIWPLFSDKEDYKTFLSGQKKSVFLVFVLYLVIALCLSIVKVAGSLQEFLATTLYAFSFLMIGWAQFSINHGMHEASHKNLLNRRTDLWAAILTAYPIGFTMRYADTHALHHQFVGTDKDPDFTHYNKFPESRWTLLKRFAWFLSGIPSILQFVYIQTTSGNVEKSDKFKDFLYLLIVQVVIISFFYIFFGNIYYYLAFWIAPVAMIGKFLSTTRFLCEHSSPDKEWVIRSIDGPRWQTWIFGCFDFNYHAEHHLIPAVPFPHLKRLHHRNKTYREKHPEQYGPNERLEYFDGGYLPLIWQWFKALPWRPHAKVVA